MQLICSPLRIWFRFPLFFSPSPSFFSSLSLYFSSSPFHPSPFLSDLSLKHPLLSNPFKDITTLSLDLKTIQLFIVGVAVFLSRLHSQLIPSSSKKGLLDCSQGTKPEKSSQVLANTWHTVKASQDSDDYI